MYTPESFQRYSEDREDPAQNYGDGLFADLYKKLNETRRQIEESGALEDASITTRVEDSYKGRERNSDLNDQKNDIERKLNRINDAISVARQIEKMRSDANLPADTELSDIIEKNLRDKMHYESRIKDLESAIEANQASHDKLTENSSVMAKIEDDAYTENKIREQK